MCIGENPEIEGRINITHNMRVSYPPNMPAILGYDSGAPLRVGDIQRFNCVALGGNPPATLKWYKGDREISAPMMTSGSGVSSELMIRIQLNDNGAFYRCEAHNAALKKPMSAFVRLTVHFPATFVNISVNPPEPRHNDNVTLTCTSGSSNPLSRISWKKDGSFVRDHREETLGSVYGGIATRSRLSFLATSRNDGSSFTCQARNDIFKSPVSRTIVLRIRHKPAFSHVYQTIDVEEHQTAVFNLTADAYPNVTAYTWFRNGEKLGMDSTLSRVTARGSLFFLRNSSREDSGFYHCQAENEEGSSNSTVVLNILYGASIVNLSRTDSSGPLTEGKSASFECVADGNPVKNDMIEWGMRGAVVREGQSMVFEGGRRSILKISSVSRDMKGSLECIANNGIGDPAMLSLMLQVLYKPVITRSVGLTVGKLGRLRCAIDGTGDVEVTWHFNNTVLHSLGNNKYQVTLSRQRDNEWISMITINNISSVDYGVYTCTAENDLGHNAEEIFLGEQFYDPSEATTAITPRDFTGRFYGQRFWWIPAAGVGVVTVLLICITVLCCMKSKSKRNERERGRRARHIDITDLTADEVCNKLLLSADVKSLLLCAAEKQRIPLQDFKEHSVFTIDDAFAIDIMRGRPASKAEESKLNDTSNGVKETILEEIPHAFKQKDDRPDILRNEKGTCLATIKEVSDSQSPLSGSPESPRFASTPSGSTGSCLSVYHEKVPLRSLGADVENSELMKLHPIVVLAMGEDAFKFSET